MAKKSNKTINVQGIEIRLALQNDGDYFSLTDIARKANTRTEVIIQSWLGNRSTIEFLGGWEELYNPDFNHIGFDVIRNQTRLNATAMSAKKWITETSAIGIRSKAGRYGGTYAHKDIAFEFLFWINPTFKLYVIKEFQRLKEQEAREMNLEWNVKRIMAKASYPFQTEAVREHLIPPKVLDTQMEGLYFANEADLLNLALFGMTAKQWKQLNPEAKGNMRDNASHQQLLVLSVLQGLNAKLIEWGSDDQQRLELLNKAAIEWMEILVNRNNLDRLPGSDNAKLLK